MRATTAREKGVDGKPRYRAMPWGTIQPRKPNLGALWGERQPETGQTPGDYEASIDSNSGTAERDHETVNKRGDPAGDFRQEIGRTTEAGRGGGGMAFGGRSGSARPQVMEEE